MPAVGSTTTAYSAVSIFVVSPCKPRIFAEDATLELLDDDGKPLESQPDVAVDAVDMPGGAALSLSWVPRSSGAFGLRVCLRGVPVHPHQAWLHVAAERASHSHSVVVRPRQRRRGRGVMAALLAEPDASATLSRVSAQTSAP